jgi:cell division septal protein FtsQ
MPITMGAAVVLAGLSVAATWPGFDAKTILVNGNERVSRAEIVARAHVTPHLTIWLQNTGAMVKRIAAIPYVDAVRVRRIPPSTIRIVVTERRPYAVIRSGDEEALVDRALRVLEPAAVEAAYPVLALPAGAVFEPGEFVRDRSAIGLRDAYESITARNLAVVALQYDRFGGLIVTLRGGVRLLLGNTGDLSEKLTLADAILTQVVNGRRRVAAVDLRAPSAPVLVYR